MLLAFVIYMIDLLHSLDNGFIVVLTFIILAALTLFLCGIAESRYKKNPNIPEEEKDYQWEQYCYGIVKRCLTILVVMVGVVFLAPDKETSYTMLAAYGVSEAYEVVSENENVQRIATKSLSVIEKHIDSYMEGMDTKDSTNTQTEGETQ